MTCSSSTVTINSIISTSLVNNFFACNFLNENNSTDPTKNNSVSQFRLNFFFTYAKVI